MYAVSAMKDLLAWWTTVPTWAKPVVLAFALGLAVTIVRAVPWAIKQVKALWKWDQDRRDGKVLALMAEGAREARLEHPTMNIALIPFKIEELAKRVKRSENSVYKSLRRLEAAGKVLEVKRGEWCLGNRTQKELLNEQWRGGAGGGRFDGGRFNRT